MMEWNSTSINSTKQAKDEADYYIRKQSSWHYNLSDKDGIDVVPSHFVYKHLWGWKLTNSGIIFFSNGYLRRQYIVDMNTYFSLFVAYISSRWPIFSWGTVSQIICNSYWRACSAYAYGVLQFLPLISQTCSIGERCGDAGGFGK